jgi:hypothetical protein
MSKSYRVTFFLAFSGHIFDNGCSSVLRHLVNIFSNIAMIADVSLEIIAKLLAFTPLTSKLSYQ